MPSQIQVGNISLFSNPVPLRHCQRDLSISMAYFQLCHSIEIASNVSRAKAIAKDTLLRLAPLYEGEKIIRLLEEALASSSQATRKQNTWDKSPISRDEYDQILVYRALQLAAETEECMQPVSVLLTDEPYAFDLIHYDEEFQKILWINLAYGIAEQPALLKNWKEQSQSSALKLAQLAAQYYGVEIKHVEIACIDPFLEHSRKDIAIWSLADADQLTGKAGAADKIAIWRSAYRRHQHNMINGSTTFDEQQYLKQLTAELRDIVYLAQQNYSGPSLRVLTPS